VRLVTLAAPVTKFSLCCWFATSVLALLPRIHKLSTFDDLNEWFLPSLFRECIRCSRDAPSLENSTIGEPLQTQRQSNLNLVILRFCVPFHQIWRSLDAVPIFPSFRSDDLTIWRSYGSESSDSEWSHLQWNVLFLVVTSPASIDEIPPETLHAMTANRQGTQDERMNGWTDEQMNGWTEPRLAIDGASQDLAIARISLTEAVISRRPVLVERENKRKASQYSVCTDSFWTNPIAVDDLNSENGVLMQPWLRRRCQNKQPRDQIQTLKFDQLGLLVDSVLNCFRWIS
jgi:hypothetical protein